MSLFTKLSICLLYPRVFGVKTTFRRFVYSATTLCIVCHTAQSGISVALVSRCQKCCRRARSALRGTLHLGPERTLASHKAYTSFEHHARGEAWLHVHLPLRLSLSWSSLSNGGRAGSPSQRSALGASIARLIAAVSVRLHSQGVLYHAVLSGIFSSVPTKDTSIQRTWPSLLQNRST